VSAAFSRVDKRYGVLFDAERVERIAEQHLQAIQWPPVARPRTYKAEPARAHDEPPRFGLFHLHCNNSKRRAGKPMVYVDCDGSLYPDGLVHLHTVSLTPTDFVSWQQFATYMDGIGEYRVVWLALPPSGEVLS